MIAPYFPMNSWDCPLPCESNKGIQGVCFAKGLREERGIDVAKLDEWGQQIQEQVRGLWIWHDQVNTGWIIWPLAAAIGCMSYQVEDHKYCIVYSHILHDIWNDIPFRLHVFDMYVAVALYTSH